MIFPSKRPRKLHFSEFERQTEVELACVFRRIPRSQPYPDEVPFYPYLPSRYDSPPYRVSFNLGFNPFTIN